MQVTEVANEGLKRAFSVVVPATDITAEREKRLAQLGKELRLPGFRPGKIPPRVVQQRYGQSVMGEVLESSVNNATQRVVSDRGLRPAQQPKIELVNFADGTDLEFKVEMEVMPEVPMPDFAGIELERLKAEPGDEQMDKALSAIAQRNRKLEDIAEERPAEAGEVAVCDFVGRMVTDGEPGEPFPGGSATDMPIEVAGEGFIPGFTEQLVGIRAGETRQVDVTFPAEYAAQELAGKAARFEVTCKALKRPVLPEIDDAMATSLGFENAEKLRGTVRETLQREYDSMARMRIKRALLDRLSERADFPVPQGMVDAEFNQIWQRVEADMKAGKLDEDDKNKDEDTLRGEYRAIAERRIRLGLLLSEIGRTNNIAVSGEELARAMRQEAARYPGQEQQVMEFFGKNRRRPGREPPIPHLSRRRWVDFMLDLAKVTERRRSPEVLAAPAA
jgi:trigger factor